MARPISLRLSSALLFGVAGLRLLGATIDLVFVNTGLSIYRDAFTGETGSGFGSLVSATFAILVAAVVSILAILNNQGSNNARIVTLVLGGLYLICGGLLTASNGLHGPARAAGGGALDRVLPAAYGISVGVLDLLVVLATLAALILLAVPPSNRFFHSREVVAYVAVPRSGYVMPAEATPPPFGSPGFSSPGFSSPGFGSPGFGGPGFGSPAHPPPPEQAPHSASIPMADPWAEPESEYQPRHQDGPPGS